MKLIPTLAFCLTLAVSALAGSPVPVEAQCTWGCSCSGDACGCNSNGSGDQCDTGGDGCVVSKCDADVTSAVFAPDGSVVPLPGGIESENSLFAAREAVEAGLPGTARWEFVAEGRSVARHCNGWVVDRYYDRSVAAAIREGDRRISI